LPIERPSEEELKALLVSEDLPPSEPRRNQNISGSIRHQCYVEKFYNAAESLLPSEIAEEIRGIDFCTISVASREQTNSQIRAKLYALGWSTEGRRDDRSRADFRKNDTELEVQLRQKTNVLHDIIKFQKAFNNERLSYAIMILFDTSVPIWGENGQDASIQSLDGLISEFVPNEINLKIPLWAIGLLPH